MAAGRNQPCPCGSGRKYKHCCAVGLPSAQARQLHALGRALVERDLFEQAADQFSRATALCPEFAEAHNDLGEVSLRLGRIDAAIASCRRALELQPRFVEAMGNLANADRARGALAEAIAGYRRVIAIEPRLAEAHRNLGSALHESGDDEAAIASLQRAVELRPAFSRAVVQLARMLADAGRGAEALSHYERLVAHDRSPGTLDEFAALLARLGRYEQSAGRYRALLEIMPLDARLHANLGHVLNCLGDYRTALIHCRRAVELGPGLPESHLHLGNSLLALNAIHEADAAYSAGLAAAPDHAGLLTASAMANRALGRIGEALSRAQRAHALHPTSADTLALLGSLAIDHGRFDEAEGLLRQALILDPELPEALAGIPAVRKMSAADAAWRDAAERALARGLPVAHAINLHHALGKYFDDVDDCAAAFRHHRRGNELARGSRASYDRAGMTRRVTRLLEVFDRRALSRPRAGASDSDRAVFIVGMPRSGTSLTEQILASHPEVHGAGELLFWIFAADAECAASPGERDAMMSDLGRTYLAGIAAQAGTASRVIDKLPVNFRHIGLIHSALPGARFIHIERDPLDTCLSIYFQGFSAAHPYATDFADLAHYYHEYRRLMAHWRAVLPPETLFEVRYEDLVDEPEIWSRRMLAHIGLPWDPRCLDFHRTQRPVLTASNWQVRQPISKTSVGRWRRYADHIGPLREALDG